MLFTPPSDHFLPNLLAENYLLFLCSSPFLRSSLVYRKVKTASIESDRKLVFTVYCNFPLVSPRFHANTLKFLALKYLYLGISESTLPVDIQVPREKGREIVPWPTCLPYGSFPPTILQVKKNMFFLYFSSSGNWNFLTISQTQVNGFPFLYNLSPFVPMQLTQQSCLLGWKERGREEEGEKKLSNMGIKLGIFLIVYQS